MPMTDDQLCQRLRESEADAIEFNSTFGLENEENLRYYLGEPFGNEVAEQSQVVSTDVQDVVESDMPSLARVFLGSGDIVTFQPNSENEADVKEAEEKTKYINWLVREQPHSFKTLLGWLKDSEIQKMGVVKYFIEDVEKTKEIHFRGLTALEIEQSQQDIDNDNVKKIDIVKQVERDTGDDEPEFDVTFRVTTKTGNRAMYEGVASEDFLITRMSSTLDDAELVGNRLIKTRSELKEMGVPLEKIKLIPRSGEITVDSERMKRLRFSDEGDNTDPGIEDIASERVELLDLSVKIDFDQDGIAERRRILKARFGTVIIENEAFDHVPFALISSILMPHNVIGRSRTDITKSNQLQKSKILRESFDNLELVNHPGTVVNDEHVNVDDLLTVRSGRIIRTDGIPQQDILPLVIPSVLDESLKMIQYLDFARAQSTGTLMASQGLDAEALTKETATRFEGVRDEGQAKIELVARGIAEVGFRKLYEGMAWLVSQFQDSPTEIMVLGKQLTVDPGKWKFDHKVKTEVGLGAGDNEQLVSVLGTIYQLQQQLKQQGSALIDEGKIFNTLERIIKGSGLPRVNEFFNDPTQPDELLKAQNEILTNAVQQLQQMVEQSQNPLAQAEQIRAQANLIEAQGKAGIEAAKVTEDARQFDDKMQQDRDSEMRQIALKLTELESKFNKELSQQNNENLVSQV